jgi:hypothetical protein
MQNVLTSWPQHMPTHGPPQSHLRTASFNAQGFLAPGIQYTTITPHYTVSVNGQGSNLVPGAQYIVASGKYIWN